MAREVFLCNEARGAHLIRAADGLRAKCPKRGHYAFRLCSRAAGLRRLKPSQSGLDTMKTMLMATVLSILAWHRIWWFTPIAIFSFANALVGYIAVKRRFSGWLSVHIGGMGGSYIALTTALLVVNLGKTTPVAWLAPSSNRCGMPVPASNWTMSRCP